MAPPVYTVHIFSLSTAVSGLHSLYTVPADRVLIVTCVDYICVNPGALLAGIYDATGGAYFSTASMSAFLEHVQWTGRQAFVAGSQLDLELVSGQVSVRGTGYLFAV